MKFLIVFVALFVVALAAPSDILKSESDVRPDGFKYAVETSDGISAHAEGSVKEPHTEHAALVVHGSYGWIDKQGVEHVVKYVADENGYRPESSDIPSNGHA